MTPDQALLVAQWLRHAKEDLHAARRLGDDADVPERIPAFHAHLAAEKALKALLILRAVPVRKIHGLRARGPTSSCGREPSRPR
jgi:HEPN domain-containing protein